MATKQSKIRFNRAGIWHMKLYQFFLRLEAGFFAFILAAWDFEFSVRGARGTGKPWEPWEDEAMVAFDICVAGRWRGGLLPTMLFWAVERAGMCRSGDGNGVIVGCWGEDGERLQLLSLPWPPCHGGDDRGGVGGRLSLSEMGSSSNGF